MTVAEHTSTRGPLKYGSGACSSLSLLMSPSFPSLLDYANGSVVPSRASSNELVQESCVKRPNLDSCPKLLGDIAAGSAIGGRKSTYFSLSHLDHIFDLFYSTIFEPFADREATTLTLQTQYRQ
jgi:hypothetical protein